MSLLKHSNWPAAFVERLKSTAPWLLATAAVVAVVSGLARRGLHADGAYYLLELLERQGFFLVEPSRLSVQLAQQAPTLVALRLGLGEASGAAIIFSLTLGLLPWVLVAATYPVLPSRYKAWFSFPLLHYFAGTTAAAFSGIVEAPVAASFFWLLFYVVLFCEATASTLIGMIVLAAPVPWLHEVMMFLGPLLAAAAVWRVWRARSRPHQVVFWLLALWFLIACVVQLGFIMNPRDPHNRDTFIREFVGLLWLTTPWGDTNVPAALGLLAIVSMIAVGMLGFNRRSPADAKGASLWVTLPFALVCLAAVIASTRIDGFMAPIMHFKARNLSALLSLPLAMVAMASLRWPSLREFWMRGSNLTILSALAGGTLAWHVVSIVYWQEYIETFQKILERHRGLMTWEQTVGLLPTPQRQLVERMAWGWTYPTMSILLSPNGVVSTLIANPTPNQYQPFDPKDPEGLPRSRFFDTRPYRETLRPRSLLAPVQ